MTLTIHCSQSLDNSIQDILKPVPIQYHCDKCDRKTSKALKSVSFVMLPKVIILHLHRFSFREDKRR
jgi:uncharacterized UBP type Zn finger protein